jgi:hypothetical protein
MDNSNVLVSSGLPYWFFFCLSSGLNAQAVSSASMDISKYTTSSSTPCFHCRSDMEDPKDQVWVCSYFIHRRNVVERGFAVVDGSSPGALGALGAPEALGALGAPSAAPSAAPYPAPTAPQQAATGGLNKDNPNAMLGTMVV